MSNSFKSFFIKSLNEDVSVGSALGSSGGDGSSGDFYATGDSRLPHALGAVVLPKRKKKKRKKRKQRKQKKSKVKETLKIPIQRRIFPGM
jgi:hypothetical protein